MKANEGQSAVELVAGMGIFLFLILSLLSFGKAGMARERALLLSRFGSSLQACGVLGPDVIEQQMNLFKKELSSPGSGWVEYRMGRYLTLPGSSFYQLMGTWTRYELKPLGNPAFIPSFKGEEIVVEQKAELEN